MSATTTRVAFIVLPSLEETVDPFARHLAGQKKSPQTVTTYVRGLRWFAASLGPEPTIADVTPQAITAFMDARADLGAATLRGILSALRAYGKWCILMGMRADDPTAGIPWPKRPDALPRALTSDELERLERILHARPRYALDPRTKRLIPQYKRVVLLMLYAGLRRQEVANLRWEAVDLGRRTIRVWGKGSKERMVTVHARLAEALRGVPIGARHGHVVTSSRGGGQRMHRAMGRIFEVWLRGEGLDISAHQLRHSFATELLRNGADIEEIRQLLGHSSLRETQRYLRLDTSRIAAAVALLPGRFEAEAGE
jgi:integrase/recombinase XerD